MLLQGPNNPPRCRHCPQLALETFDHRRHPNWATHDRTYCDADHLSVCHVSATASRRQCPSRVKQCQPVVLWVVWPWHCASQRTQSHPDWLPLTGEWHSTQRLVIVNLRKIPGNAISFRTTIPSAVPRYIIPPSPIIYFPAIRAVSVVPFSAPALHLGVVSSSATCHLFPLVFSSYQRPRKDLGGGSTNTAATRASRDCGRERQQTSHPA